MLDFLLHHAKNAFVITIGEYGAIFALHKNNKIENKIFVKDFDEKSAQNLSQIMRKNSGAPIFMVLDNSDQSYKKKEYPFIKQNDVLQLIKRDLKSDSDEVNVKSFTLLKNPENEKKEQRDKKWRCLFASMSISEVTQKYLDFLLEMPNEFRGIYSLAIESSTLFKKIKTHAKERIQNKEVDLCFFTAQNKISGLRQTVFLNDQLVFTRLLDYGSNDDNFYHKIERDVYATSEYLKRLFPETRAAKIEIISILPQEAIDHFPKDLDHEINFINYTPHQVSKLLSDEQIISQNSAVCDLVYSQNFFKEPKKLLRFDTETTKKTHILFLVNLILRTSNLAILALIAFYCVFSVYKINSNEELISEKKNQQLDSMRKLNDATSKALDGKEIIDKTSNKKIEIDRVLDIGKTYEQLSKYEGILTEAYPELKFVRNYPVEFNKISFQLKDFLTKTPEKSSRYSITLSGTLKNKSGDIEDLFSEFDALSSNFTRAFKGYEVKYSELPKNIDFAQKYFDYKVEFTIQGDLKK